MSSPLSVNPIGQPMQHSDILRAAGQVLVEPQSLSVSASARKMRARLAGRGRESFSAKRHQVLNRRPKTTPDPVWLRPWSRVTIDVVQHGQRRCRDHGSASRSGRGRRSEKESMTMRPIVRFLNEGLIQQIIAEAIDISPPRRDDPQPRGAVDPVGPWCQGRHGPPERRDHRGSRAACLQSAPRSFKLCDVLGNETHDFRGDASTLRRLDRFASTGLRIAEDAPSDDEGLRGICESGRATAGYRLPEHGDDRLGCAAISRIATSVPEPPLRREAGRHRGISIASFEVMKDLQLAVRGTARPSARNRSRFSRVARLAASMERVTSQTWSIARGWIPVEFIAMPCRDFSPLSRSWNARATHGRDTQWCRHQSAGQSGQPILYGGSPAIFDFRHETTPWAPWKR